MRTFTRFFGLVAAGAGGFSLLQGCGSSPPDDVASSTSDITTCSSGPVVEGVDVSDGQGAINWHSVKAAGVEFAIMKATQGTYNTQSTFAANWANSKSAGIIRGAYHFFDPTVDGVAQAKYFLGVVGKLSPGDLPPMLDIECPDGDSACLGWAGGSGQEPGNVITQRMNDWLHTVQSATGRTPIVYSFGSYFSGAGVDTSGLASYPLDIAYPTSGSCFNVPSPWSKATMWQWTWSGSVSGIGGQVDRDRFLGTLAQLQAFAAGANPCAKVPSADGGLYCGKSTQNGFAGGDGNTLYDCQNGHIASTSYCGAGCFVAPAGKADGCNPDPCANVPAAANGFFCGVSRESGFAGGDARTLYDCQSGKTATTQSCASGCFVAPAGQADGCVSNPCANVPAANSGLYCGTSTESGFADGAPSVLYDCQNGRVATSQTCARGCTVAPAGQPDHCN